MSDDNVIKMPPRRAPVPSVEDRDRLVVIEHGKCEHIHCSVDPELLELKCRDCGAMLNPVTYVVRIAEIWRRRDLEHKRLMRATEERRQDLEKRHRCRCEHCGRSTKIRRVSNRELARIRAKHPETPQ